MRCLVKVQIWGPSFPGFLIHQVWGRSAGIWILTGSPRIILEKHTQGFLTQALCNATYVLFSVLILALLALQRLLHLAKV